MSKLPILMREVCKDLYPDENSNTFYYINTILQFYPYG